MNKPVKEGEVGVGDEVLRRMLKTPPEPRQAPAKAPHEGRVKDNAPALTTGTSRGEIKE